MYATILFPRNNTYAVKDGGTYISCSARNVRMLEADGIKASGVTSLVVEARLHLDSEWKTYQVIDVTHDTALLEFNIVVPYIRCVVTGGAGIRIGALSTRTSDIT